MVTRRHSLHDARRKVSLSFSSFAKINAEKANKTTPNISHLLLVVRNEFLGSRNNDGGQLEQNNNIKSEFTVIGSGS